MDPTTDRRYIRAIVRQVHPDLFAAYPYERSKNSDALKVGGMLVPGREPSHGSGRGGRGTASPAAAPRQLGGCCSQGAATSHGVAPALPRCLAPSHHPHADSQCLCRSALPGTAARGGRGDLLCAARRRRGPGAGGCCGQGRVGVGSARQWGLQHTASCGESKLTVGCEGGGD